MTEMLFAAFVTCARVVAIVLVARLASAPTRYTRGHALMIYALAAVAFVPISVD